MLSTQQALQSAIDLQANAQDALPILPNNGNPRGVYNAPRRMMGQQPSSGGYDGSGIIPPHMRQPQQPPNVGGMPQRRTQHSQMTERYPWLKPSGSMDNIRGWLDSRRGMFGQKPPVPQQPTIPQQPQMQPPQYQKLAVDQESYPVLYPQLPIRSEIM